MAKGKGLDYRPIVDCWILARSKRTRAPGEEVPSRYYGSYPAGFLERARALLGVNLTDSVLHVCAGRVRQYPYRRGFGKADMTLDLDPACEPDFLQDARKEFPPFHHPALIETTITMDNEAKVAGEPGGFLNALVERWPAVLIDPPYTPEDAVKYAPGASVLPPPNLLLKNGLAAVRPGGRVGMLHYTLPQPPRGAGVVLVAVVTVIVGYNNRDRIYSVYERALE